MLPSNGRRGRVQLQERLGGFSLLKFAHARGLRRKGAEGLAVCRLPRHKVRRAAAGVLEVVVQVCRILLVLQPNQTGKDLVCTPLPGPVVLFAGAVLLLTVPLPLYSTVKVHHDTMQRHRLKNLTTFQQRPTSPTPNGRHNENALCCVLLHVAAVNFLGRQQ